DARDSADAAELDAEAARSAASQAEQDAKDARAAADRADAAATEAEQAAKDAAKYAQEAQEAADRAEKAAKAKRLGDGTVTDEKGSIGNVFYVIDRIEKSGAPEVVSKTDGCDHWWNHLAYRGNCTITTKIKYKAVLSLYLCSAEGIDPQKLMCPAGATTYLGEIKTDELSEEVTHTITIAEWQDNVDPIDILFGSWIKCAQKFAPGGESGSWTGCAWASLDVASMFAGKIIRPIAEALRAVDAAMVTGIGVRDAFRTLKALEGVDAVAIAEIEEAVDTYEEIVTSCPVNSFPGDTRVLMADGTRKAINEVRVGDLVMSEDPTTGLVQPRPVSDTYRHTTQHLVDITTSGGGVLTSTTGHRIYVKGQGWTQVSALRAGDRLGASSGPGSSVTALLDRPGSAPRTVYDLTVGGLHTFFVYPQGARTGDVLVHNCTSLRADEGQFGAHSIEEHVTVADATAYSKAQTNKAGVVGKWADAATAEAAVQQAMREWEQVPGNADRLRDWKIREAKKQSKPGYIFNPEKDTLPFDWEVRNGPSSLGKVFLKNGDRAGEAAGNRVRIVLKYVGKAHKPTKFVVYTSYPLPKQ
ncbi:polymorphic toxin-type HINT domain-containing protein, partial [Streptomyces echinatus]|uniref:polymorphic toxin-type HINT domain-containing protein n=1 Tax=Streptomyces echinatus TaxID=67293 RepID=UPI0037BB95FF